MPHKDPADRQKYNQDWYRKNKEQNRERNQERKAKHYKKKNNTPTIPSCLAASSIDICGICGAIELKVLQQKNIHIPTTSRTTSCSR
jgi:hypothetical protein